MLQNLEEKHGRAAAGFTPKDLPNIRKTSIEKWLSFHHNKAPWQLYV
jgi:hypothetical protein